MPINFRTTFNLFQVKNRLKSFSIMVSILLGTIFSRMFDATCIVDEKLVPKPNILPQLKPQIETVSDASLWRLINVFMNNLWNLWIWYLSSHHKAWLVIFKYSHWYSHYVFACTSFLKWKKLCFASLTLQLILFIIFFVLLSSLNWSKGFIASKLDKSL